MGKTSGSINKKVSEGKLKINQRKNVNEEEDRLNWWLVFFLICGLTAATRYYKVTEPDHVCWDETHFGKMGSWYINRTFFFDVHPPLGKMLIALSGVLTGYNGTYSFEKPGDKYNGTKYEGMRIFCTTLGALIVPMVFDTVWTLTNSEQAALIAAAYIIFDVGMLALNQYILLDPILLFFMTGSIWGMIKISKTTQNGQSYSVRWWFWLFFTGTMLACTVSVKFVGLFTVILVGLHTINELWNILGDLSKPMRETFQQLICRAITLILWPSLLYLIFFYIHLTVLNHSGNGDGFYSSAFQSRLIGNSLYNATMPRDVAYGSIVTIKNHKTGGGYLHSHYHLYPKGIGARQQQITTYTHKDDNNKWLIKPYNKDSYPKVRILKHGDLIRLEHVQTKRNLHSHREPAPLTKKHNQVTGYGENGTGDANDVWKILIIGGRQNDPVLTVTTKLLIVHYLQNCALTTSGKQLPKWGFEQQEVSCNPNIRDKNAYWNIEDNSHNKLPNVNFQVYAPGFFARFIESHAVMFQGNSGLKPKEGEVTSRPWQWPINYRGQFFSGNTYRIYLLGNPIIWWSNLIFLGIFLIVYFMMAIKQRRSECAATVSINDNGSNSSTSTIIKSSSNNDDDDGIAATVVATVADDDNIPNNNDDDDRHRKNNKNGKNAATYNHSKNENENSTNNFTTAKISTSRTSDKDKKFLNAALWLFIGWLLHYVPFWAMGRVLYFHHYFPALLFNSMLTGVIFGYITYRLSKWIQHTLLGLFMAVLVYSFQLFSPLAYGMSGPLSNEPNSTMYGLKWMASWEF